MFDYYLLLVHIVLTLRTFVNVVEPVIFTLNGLSVFLYGVAILLFTCILLFVIHWKTKKNKDEEDTGPYEPVPVSVNHYVEDPVQERKPSVDEVDQWHYPTNDLKNLQYNTIPAPAYYEEIRIRRDNANRREDPNRRVDPPYLSYTTTNYNEPSWGRASSASEVINSPQRGYYQPGTPLPMGYEVSPNQHRYSHYDNVPNQNKVVYPVNYLKNSDLVQV